MSGCRNGTSALLAVVFAATAMAPVTAQSTTERQRPLRIGIVASVGAVTVTQTQHLSDVLGIDVNVVPATNYVELVEAQLAGRVDYAVLSAAAFAAASSHCSCLKPLAAPLSPDGSVGLRSVLIVRSGNDEPPRRIAIGPEDSMATRLAPVTFWPQLAQARKDGRLVDAATASEAEAWFRSGEADALFGWVPATEHQVVLPTGGTLSRLEEAGLSAGDFKVAWTSPLLPHGPHVVRADMAEEQAAALAAALRRHEDGRAFRLVSQEDYAAVLQVLERLRSGG